MKTATELSEELDTLTNEKILHERMKWFFEKHAPIDKYASAEFHADLIMVMQAIHQDASRHTHALLQTALKALPPISFVPK